MPRLWFAVRHREIRYALLVTRWVALLGITACASAPQDLCDRSKAAGISRIANKLYYDQWSAHHGGTFSVKAPFTCAGGGGGTLDVGGAEMWSGTFIFDTCTANGYGSGDLLTLTGTFNAMGDFTNGVSWGQTDSIAIRGSLADCRAPVDETCAGMWSPFVTGAQGEGFDESNTQGTLCGRKFP